MYHYPKLKISIKKLKPICMFHLLFAEKSHHDVTPYGILLLAQEKKCRKYSTTVIMK